MDDEPSGSGFEFLEPATAYEPPVLKALSEKELARSTVSKFRRALNPLIGPSEKQKLQESIVTSEGEVAYKPAGSLADEGGLVAILTTGASPMADKLVAPSGSDASSPEKIGRGFARGALRFAGSLASPVGMLMPVVPMTGLAARAAAGAFGATMAKGVWDSGKVLAEAIEDGDLEKAAEAVTSGSLSGYFGYRSIKHAASPGLARESDTVRNFLTERVIKEYSPRSVRDIVRRVESDRSGVKGDPQATAGEHGLYDWIMQEVGETKPAIKGGARVETTTSRIKNQKLRDWLGMEADSATLTVPEAPPKQAKGQPYATGPREQPPSDQQEPRKPAEEAQEGRATRQREPERSEDTVGSGVPAGTGVKVEEAAAKTDPFPTEAQKEAGNYTKGKVSVQGLPVTIETPKGAERTGTDKTGREWSVTMPAHYGYINRTEGKDGDHVDVYVGPNPDSGQVFIIDQVNPDTQKFDEHKVMLGFESQEQAVTQYDAAFSDARGLERMGRVTPLSMEQFKRWLKEGDTTKPYAFKLTSPETDLIERVHGMTGEQFAVLAQPGAPLANFTQHAYDLGRNLKKKSDLDRLRTGLDHATAMFREAGEKGDAMAAVNYGAKAQFFSEAIGAATGTGSAAESLLTLDPKYKPPFPEPTKGVETREEVQGQGQKEVPLTSSPSSVEPAPGVGGGPAPSARFEVSSPPSTGKKPIIARGEWDIIDASAVGFTGGVTSFQERNRGSAQSKQQIADISAKLDPRYLGESATAAEGAPIIADNGEKLAGYGRLAAIKQAYQAENTPSKIYREFVQREAGRLGITPKLEGIAHPILVRRVTEFQGGTAEQFAADSNQAQALQFTPTELALSDAKVLKENKLLDAYTISEDGVINRQFLDQFYNGIKARDGLKSTDGQTYLPAMTQRVKIAILTALLSEAQNPEVIIRKIVEEASELGIARQVNGLSAVAGKLVNLATLNKNYDLRPHLAVAFTEYIEAKAQMAKGWINSVQDYMDQQTLFSNGRTPESGVILEQLFRLKTVKDVAAFFDGYARRGLAIARDAATVDMFATLPAATVLDILQRSRLDEKPTEQQTELLGRRKPDESSTRERDATGTGGVDTGTAVQAEQPLPFEQLGQGHKKFHDSLTELVKNGTLDEERRILLEEIFRDTNDDLLSAVDVTSSKALKRGGQYGQRVITLRRGMLARRESGEIKGPLVHSSEQEFWLNPVNEPVIIFLHEYGHAAYDLILNDEDHQLVAEVYKGLKPKKRQELFMAMSQDEYAARYYAKNEKEFLAQAFAEWVASKKVPDNRLLAVLRKLYEHFMAAIRRLMNLPSDIRAQLDKLTPIFEKMMAGGDKPLAEILKTPTPRARPAGTVSPTAATAARAIQTAATRGQPAVRTEAQLITGQVGYLHRKLSELSPNISPNIEPAVHQAVMKRVGFSELAATVGVVRHLVPPEEFYAGMQRLANDPLRETYAKEVGMRFKLLNQHLEGVIREHAKAAEYFESEAWKHKAERYTERASMALWLDLAQKYFNDTTASQVAAATELLQKQSFNEGQAETILRSLKTYEAKQGYTEAVSSAVRDIVNTFAKNEEFLDLLYNASPANMREIIDTYRRLKPEGRPEDMIVQWAAELLAQAQDISRGLVVAATLRDNERVRKHYDAFERKIADAFKKNPKSAAKAIIRGVEKFATDAEKARAAFKVINREMERRAFDFEVQEQSADLAKRFLEDPETKQYALDVYKAGKVQDRPKDMLDEEYDSLKLEQGIGLPDGSNTGPLTLYGDTAKFETTYNAFNAAAQNIAEWLANNPSETTVDYWRRKLEYLQNVLATSRTLAPTKLTGIRDMGPWGMTKFFVDDIGTREGARLKVSLGNHARADELAKQLLRENFSKLAIRLVNAAKSHGFTETHGNNRGAIVWYEEIGNALYSSWQNPEGGLTVGEYVNGHQITQADIDALSFTAEVTRSGFRIVQQDVTKGREGVAQPVFFKTTIADTGIPIHVQSTPVTQYTVTRSYNPKSLGFIKSYVAARTPEEKIALLDANFWNVVVRHMADRSNVFFDGTSPLDYHYRAISRDIQRNGLPYQNRNMRWLLSTLLDRGETEPGRLLIAEFDKMMYRLGNEVQKEPDQPTVITEAKSSFTEARKQKLAGDWLYNHGWKDNGEFVGFSMAITGYYYNRAAQDFLRVSEDLDRQRRDLENKMRELAQSRGQPSATAKERRDVVKAQSARIQLGQTFDDYDSIDKKIKWANRYAEIFSQVYGEGQNVEYDLGAVHKVFGATTGSVLMSELTALRNIGFGWLYLGQAINKYRGTVMSGYVRAAWETWGVTFPKFIGSSLVSAGKAATVGLAKGVKEGLWSAMNREGRVAVARFLKPMLEEMTQSLFERVRLQRELFEKGYATPTYAPDDFLAKIELPTTGGAVMENPIVESTMGQMGFGALTIYDAFILTTVGRPLLPRWADINVNMASVKSAFDVIQNLENQLRRIHAFYREKGVSRWNFSQLNDPANLLTPDEILGKWFGGRRTGNDVEQLRMIFEWTGKGYQEWAMDFLQRLEANPADPSPMMPRESVLAFADQLAEEVNKASATNRPLQFKQKGIWQIVAPLLGWNAQRLRTYFKYFSRASVDPNTSRFMLWVALGLLFVLPAIFMGGVSDVVVEEQARLLYGAFRGEKRATRQPWEREDQLRGWTISMANPIPFVQTLANTALNDMPNRASADPILFLQSKAVDVAKYIGGVVETKDMTYGLPRLLKGFIPLTSVFVNRLPETEGSIEALNARRLMTRHGPMELVKDYSGSSTSGTANELSPYGERMLNAAMRGDDQGFLATYREGVGVARRMGRSNPEKLLTQMFSARNPYDRAFKQKLTPEQREDFLAKLSPADRDLVERVEAKYEHAAGLVGAPSTFARIPKTAKPEETVVALASRGSRRVGRRSRVGRARVRFGRAPRLRSRSRRRSRRFARGVR